MSKDEPSGAASPAPGDGWRLPSGTVSLPEVHGTVPVPTTGSFWRKLFAFAGPGYLVAVGYMDPGHDLELRESDEMKADRDYLEQRCSELTSRGFVCGARLALGDPATELVKVAVAEKVDLIAMSTHGHRFFNDLLRGSTADRVRHDVTIPVLLVRAIST